MKRAQASLEFLTTYGWAFLVIMVMIGALSYYGITNPTVFVPERCAFSPEISCEDFQVLYHSTDDVGVVMVNLKQTTGKSIFIENFLCTEIDTDTPMIGYYNEGSMAPSQTSGKVLLPFNDGGDPDLKLAQDDWSQWDPAEDVTLKCVYGLAFQARIDERVRVPITLIIQKRDGGFDHEIQGELIGVVQEMT